jgi:uncharacterized membrane protein
MRILWRVLLLAALHFGVLVCFPDYTDFAPVTVFIIFLLSTAGMIAATSLMSMMGLSGYFFMNTIFDVIMVIIVGVILLIFTPQVGGVRPFDRVMNGQYPTRNQIDRGLKRFGLGGIDKEIQKTVDSAAKDIKHGFGEVKSVVVKEDRD